MAKFQGVIGFGDTQETKPGVWDDIITERTYLGDVERNARHLMQGDKVNDDISTSNSISIIADQYAMDNFFAMRYIEWAGTLWIVADVEVQRPRLLLRLGGVYHGPKAPVADPA